MPNPLERRWTWQRPPQAWIDEGCRELSCTHQIQGPAESEGGQTVRFSFEPPPPATRTLDEVLRDVHRITRAPTTRIRALNGSLLVWASEAEHAALRAWLRPQLCAWAHDQ